MSSSNIHHTTQSPAVSHKTHYLNLNKVNERISENILSNYDHGGTSVTYLLAKHHENQHLNIHENNNETFENDTKISISNLDNWRQSVKQKALRTTSKRFHDEKNQEVDERKNIASVKSTAIHWQEVPQSPDEKCYINFVLKKRTKLKWNIQLPIYGAGVSSAMKNYVNQIVNEFNPVTCDNGEFVYCLPKQRNNPKVVYDPYNLEIVNETQVKNEKIYFTCSATYVTMIYTNDSKHTKQTNVMQWMWEEKLFNMLRGIRTFKLFRMWRTFQCLRANIREQRNLRCKRFLHRRLFFANEIFQSALVHVRLQCERISSSSNGTATDGTKSNLIMLKCDPNVTLSLDEFFSIQDHQIDACLNVLVKFKEDVMQIAYDSCITVGEMEGINFDAFFNPDSFYHQEIAITNFSESRYTRTVIMRDQNLNFQPQNLSGPSFIERKEWRHVLQRLKEFLRSIDYLIQEMLHRIVKESIHNLHSFLFKSSNCLQTKVETIKENLVDNQYDTSESVRLLLDEIKAQSIIEKVPEPIFYTELVLNVDQKNQNIDSDDSDYEENQSPGVGQAVASEKTRKKSKVVSIFDEKPKKVSSPTSTKISKESVFDVYLAISPNENEYKNAFHDLITKCEQTAGKIQTLFHEPKFSIFVDTPDYELTRVEQQMKQSNETSKSQIPWPEVEFLFGEDVSYQDVVSDIMRIVDTWLRNTLKFAKNYEQYCQMVSSYFKLNIDESINEKVWSPDEFQMVLAKYTEQISSIEAMVITQRIGFIHFLSKNFKQNCLPYAKRVIQVIDTILPSMAVQRNEKLQETIRDALKMLDRDPLSVEDFVEHLSVLSKINNELPMLENEFLTVNRLFSIANEFNLSISPENYAFFKSLGSTFQHLKSSLLYTEAQCEDNIRKFTIDLNNMIARVHKDSIELRTRLQSPRLLSLDTTPQVANENLKLFDEMIQKFIEQAKNYAAYQERFGNTIKQVKKKVTAQDYLYQEYGSYTITILTLQTELNDIEHDINLRKLLWNSIEEWEKMVKDWLSMLLDKIRVDDLQRDMNRFTQNIFLLEKGLPHNDLVPKLREKIFDFKKAMPIIVALRNPNLEKRHWTQLRGIIGRDIMDNQELTLGLLLEADVIKYKEKISDVSSLATNEATLKTMLDKTINIWKKTEFKLVADSSKDTFILTSTEEISLLLEESQLTMATIKSSRYVGPIKTDVDDLDRKLVLFSKTLEEWSEFQKKWLYLEQIFGTPDIQRQLPTETKIFTTIDKFWKELMRKTDEKPNAMKAATTTGLLENLQTNNLQMEKIQRSLEDYFETKRLIFPRLYFLSNEDLLDILSQSKEPLKIQTHMNKFFGNVRAIELSSQQSDIVNVVSAESEKLELMKPLRVRGASEQWLLTLENSIFDSVKRYLKQGLADYLILDYEEWILKHIGQVVLTVGQINFNKKVLASLTQHNPTLALEDFKAKLISSINTVANMVSKEIPIYKIQSIEALLTIDVHSRDILIELIDNHVTSSDDFEWTRNLRYEWDDFNNQCSVLHSNATFAYGYEYLGCSPRLVITPLTDRCYLTLSGALKLNLGGAPAGPAGTGKTETVKDLAKSIGKLCLVFNCSESLDYKILGKFFSGIAQSGSWCCFDEFNRIDIEVLSVVSQQILTIKTAKDANAPRFLFEGREIKLNVSSGIFITMNPTYAGRVELPDNLKPLFRPVAMMVPDYALIAEIILFSVGFTSAKVLSQKIVTLYHLATRQLSQQDHYDFGMRAIKSVLLMAGQVKKNWSNQVFTQEDEAQILVQSLYDTNLPKFLKDDAILFQNLMNDLFPILKKSKKKQDLLEKSVMTAVRELGYQLWPSQIEKIIQLYNQMLVRHGIMLVGPTGGGKTVARNILHRALTLMPTQQQQQSQAQTSSQKTRKNKVDCLVINPKSITIDELYGFSDINTLEWYDGILGSSIRLFTNQLASSDGEHNEHHSIWHWIVLDGPVDTNWVENLNSVLDDSKVLCLSNGERIYLNSTTRLFFEVDSLINTSPATVSRCAMVYFEPADLDVQLFIKNWFSSLPKETPTSVIELFNELMDFSLEKGFHFVYSRKQSTHFYAHKQSILQTLLGILKSYLEFFVNNGGFGQSKDVDDQKIGKKSKESLLGKKQYFLQRNPKQIGSLLSKIFIFAYFWAFGGILKREDNVEDDNIINQKSHVKAVTDSLTQDFDEFLRELFESNVKFGIYLPPSSKPVFDYFIDVDSGNFVEWNQLVPSVDTLIRKAKDESVAVVETVDLIRYSFVSTLLLKSRYPVLLTGISGVGKTTTVQNMLRRLVSSGYGLKPNTILGEVFNFSDKNKTIILDTLTSLMSDETPSTATNQDSQMKQKIKTEDLTLLANTIQFSAQTNSKKFLNMLVSRFSKKGHNTLGAPKNKWILTFIDDLNMPMADKFGDQAPLELFRFILENNGFQESRKNTFKSLSDITYIACCDPPSSGRSVVTSRLLRQFCILALPEPSARSLLHIYHVQLGKFFSEHDFSSDVKLCLPTLVSASVVMWYRIVINMLPTPTKSHYIFNLRDLSKLIRGLMQANPMIIVNKDNLVHLFAHECIRVFCDRLIADVDKESFYSHMNDTLNGYFKTSAKSFKYASDEESVLLYGDFLKADDRVYQQISDWKQLVSVLSEYQIRYNMSGASYQKIVFFKEACEHICRAARVLRQAGGHLLLIGLDGIGKFKTIELASFICNAQIFKLNIKKGYNYEDFRDDLKLVFKLTGIQKKKIVFFVTDKDFYEESFLEDLDSLLSSGNIPDLFDQDELEAITSELKTDAMEAGISDDRSELFKFLIQRVKNHLHVVLSMSPAGSQLRERCRYHPALINCTTIDWFNDWSDYAMEQVSKVYMENMDFSIGTLMNLNEKNFDELKRNISKTCVFIHKSLVEVSIKYYEEHKRRYYVTPSFFMDLLRNFDRILDQRRSEYMEKLVRLRTGLEKLSEANELVTQMRTELIRLGPQIETKAIETENLMSKLLKDQEAVNEVRSIVSKEEEKMRIETDMVQEYANEAEKELNDVVPILQAATESLETLKKSDISEIRVYSNPPFLVMTVMCAICAILQKKPDWTTAKQLLADSSFINRLIDFDKNSITDKVYMKIRQFSKNPDFTPEIVGTVSIACKSLCSWVLALQRYHEVHRTVKPKEDKVREANEALNVMKNGLKKKQNMLAEIQGHLDAMRAKYEESLNERKLFEDRKEMIRKRVERAVELTRALETEKIRWTQQNEELSNDSNSIIGTSLIFAASVNYLGALTQDYRLELLTTWTNFCHQNNLFIKENFDLTKHIIPQHIIRNWIAHQLPDDQYSIENAIFIKNSIKWPLIIDPEEQATRWIREMERVSLKSVKSEDPSLFRVVEQAIRLGESILIENIGESLDPALDPILKKEIITKGAQKFIKLGDVEVDYNDSFRLYLTTSLPNPHYLPSTFIKVNLINFTITFKCLTEQFLSLVVLKERPELEAERLSLMESISNDTMTLRALEDKSLSILSESESPNDGNSIDSKTILDDQNLIDVLKNSKTTSGDILLRLAKNEETEKRLNAARQKYDSIATRGAILYFTIKSLSTLNVMYQFSLNWFYSVFQSCLGVSQEQQQQSSLSTIKTSQSKFKPISLVATLASKNTLAVTPIANQHQTNELLLTKTPRTEAELDLYIHSIIDQLTLTIYKVVSWTLFAEHQLLFSFSLCVNILKNNQISNEEHKFFMNSSIIADLNHERLTLRVSQHDRYKLKQELQLDEKILKEIVLLEETLPDKFGGLINKMQEDSQNLWKTLKEEQEPYEFIKKNHENLTKFQRILLIKLIRKDALINSIQAFIGETLGKQFLDHGVPTLQELHNQSSPQRPIIFILSPGSDPASSLIRFAKDTRGSTLHMDIISLGQGQGPRAEELIIKSQILKGRWIFLQNCHLAASFMPRLQNLVNNFNRPGAEIDSQFRLYLSSKPTASFPVSLLQAGIKMTIESPRGLKNNLKQNFISGGIVNKKIFEERENGDYWRRLVFNLGFFHAIIHERKKFGPLGWNLAYEFNNSDLEVALLQLQTFLISSDKPQMSFNVLKYLTGEVIYGGRVTDDFDRRCLLSILGIFFSNESIKTDYFYASNDHTRYRAPELSIDFTGIIEYIEKLPDADDPRVFGMNIYAEKLLLSQRADHLIQSISVMEPSKTSSIIGTNTSDNEVVLKFCEDIANTLPEEVKAKFDKKKHLCLAEAFAKLQEKMGNSYYENAALLSVLRQEIDRYNRLLSVIHKTINDLIKALKGEIVISKSLENVFHSIFLQRVPSDWSSHSYASLKSLALWIKNLIKRVEFFSLWSKTVILYAESASTQIYPYSFWISGFFFPQGLLTAISQNYARKLKVAIDSLKFKFEIQNELVDEDEYFEIEILYENEERYKVENGVNGLLINGFFIDGAKWDLQEKCIVDSETRFTVAPYFLAKIVLESEVKEDSHEKLKFKCPVYRNSIRAGSANDQSKNFVTTIELDCKEDPDFWILRGSCMILQSDN